MFTTRQKLFLGGAVLLAVLVVVGSYSGSRWLFGPDVEPITEYVLPDEPLPTPINRPVRAYVPQQTSSVPESEDELFSDSETESDSTNVDEDLEAQLAALSDEELTALAEALEQDEGESSHFPPVPEGFPSNLTPVWIKHPNYQKGDMPNHENIDRVLIKLWNQGDRDFVNGVYKERYGRVYPLYPDVVYVKWRNEVYPDGTKFPYISSTLATHQRGDPRVNQVGSGLFTFQDMISGAYKTKYPDLKLVAFEDAGYDPATFLDDH